MGKTFFIIPGFTHASSNPQYTWLKRYVKSLGYTAYVVPITWKRRVMSDHIEEFLTFFEKHKTEENSVLGFSFGAMIAFLSATKTLPHQLYLCSLSPYFSEDLRSLRPSWQTFIGTHRMRDFKTHSALKTAPQIHCNTQLFCGAVEAEKFPTLLKRCKQVAKDLPHGSFTFVKDAPHQLNFPEYQRALKNSIR